jgi:RHS repeat-associated protein
LPSRQIPKPDAADPTKEAYNPYRYNAKRWDAQSGTYDMGFRDYNPGLNRNTTRDMYNRALADMGPGVDPFTGNRYVFTAGKPANRIEIDGHTSCDITGMCGGVYRETPMIRAEQRAEPSPAFSPRYAGLTRSQAARSSSAARVVGA